MKRTRFFALLCALVFLGLGICSGASAADFGYAGGKGPLTLTENSQAGLAVGEQLQLAASGNIAACTSSKTKVAVVTGAGLITAKKAGKTTITVTTGNNLTFKLDLTVVDPKKPSGIYFSKKKLTTYAGMKTDLRPYLKGKPYENILNVGSVSWKSSNPKVVTVSKKGQITAQGVGTAKITATTKNKKTATITITVKKNKVDNISKKPMLSDGYAYNHYLYLKSIEIVSPKKVVVEYYLLFTYPSWCTAKYFDYVYTDITYRPDPSSWESKQLVYGESGRVNVNLKGQHVGTFKVTYTGKQVQNTNVRLSKVKDTIRYDWSSFLNYVY